MPRHEGIILGWPYKTEGGRQIVDWENPYIDKGEGHLCAAAGTGAGKGVSYAVPAALDWPGSLVAIDVKGELTAITARARREMGQEVYVLDPFCMLENEKADGLNPLDLVDADREGCEADARSLASFICGDWKRVKDPFWDERAESFIAASILVLADKKVGDEPNCADIARVVECGAKGRATGLFAARAKKSERDDVSAFVREYFARRAGQNHAGDEKQEHEDKEKKPCFWDVMGARQFGSGEEPEAIEFEEPSVQTVMGESDFAVVRAGAAVLSQNEPRVLSSIRSVASSKLSFVEGGRLGAAISKTTIELERFEQNRPCTVYIVIPPDKLMSHARILRMWVGTLLKVMAKRRRWTGKQTLFLVDEAAQLGRLNELLSAVTLMRGYGVKVWSFWQDLSQLQQLYPFEWRTILNNCSVQLWFGLNNGRMAMDACMAAGGFTKEELMKMDRRDAVLVRAGDPPEIVRRPNYLRQDVWQGRFDENPFVGGDALMEDAEGEGEGKGGTVTWLGGGRGDDGKIAD